jgi:hypothetical protein
VSQGLQGADPDGVQDLQVGVHAGRQDLQASVQNNSESREHGVHDGREPNTADLLALGRVPALTSPLDDAIR